MQVIYFYHSTYAHAVQFRLAFEVIYLNKSAILLSRNINHSTP